MKFVDIMKRMSAMDQLLYPEGLGVMYFVNAPFLFSGPWKAIRGLMAEVPPPLFSPWDSLHIVSGPCVHPLALVRVCSLYMHAPSCSPGDELFLFISGVRISKARVGSLQ